MNIKYIYNIHKRIYIYEWKIILLKCYFVEALVHNLF